MALMDSFDNKEYTRLRDIAQKRIKRMEKAGLDVSGMRVPTIKQLKQGTALDKDMAMSRLKEMVSTGWHLQKRVEARRERERLRDPEEKRQRRREQQREYRRMKVAREQERADYPKKYQSYVKGIKKLGVDIPPSKLPAFFKYMDYRFAQGNASKKYVFDIFVDDYQQMLQKGYKPDQILTDFQRFEADQMMLMDRAGSMSGMSVEKAIGLWDKFIGQ